MVRTINDTHYAGGERKRLRTGEFALAMAVLLNNLSQLPFFVENEQSSLICMVAWMLAAVPLILLLVIGNRANFNRLVMSFLLPGGILIATAFFGVITQNSYSLLNKNILISLATYAVAFLYSSVDKDLDPAPVIKTYIFSATVVAIVIYFQFFSSADAVYEIRYAYASKNSVAFIFLAALIMCMTKKKETKAWKRWVYAICGVILVGLVILLKSRSAYIGVALSLLVVLQTKDFDKRIKRLVGVVLVGLLLLLLLKPSVYDFVVDNLLLSNKRAEGLDAVSSGRISILKSFPQKIEGNYWLGAGSEYFECFPLASLINYGVILGPLVILFSLSPLYWYARCRRSMEVHERVMFLCFAVSFYSNALFECLAPFGPGAKCSVLWVMIGLFYGRQRAGKTNDSTGMGTAV